MQKVKQLDNEGEINMTNLAYVLPTNTKTELFVVPTQENELLDAKLEYIIGWGDAFIQKVVNYVSQKIEEEYDENGDSYIDDGVINLREDHVFEQAMDGAADYFNIAEEKMEELSDAVWESLDHAVFSGAEEMLSDMHHESTFYHRDPWGYHGIRQSDFL